MLVAESAVCAQLNLVKLAEVVCVQPKQLGEDRLLVWPCRVEFNLCEWFFCVSAMMGLSDNRVMVTCPHFKDAFLIGPSFPRRPGLPSFCAMLAEAMVRIEM